MFSIAICASIAVYFSAEEHIVNGNEEQNNCYERNIAQAHNPRNEHNVCVQVELGIDGEQYNAQSTYCKNKVRVEQVVADG